MSAARACPAALLAASLLAACTAGPDYVRPAAPVPVRYKEAEGWKLATPRPAASRTAWWSIYGDPLLELLQQQIEVNSQTLRSAEAGFRESRALARASRGGLFPTVDVEAAAVRTGGVGRSSGSGSASTRSISTTPSNSFDATASAAWELDLWGRVRRDIESAGAAAQASAGDLAAARLSLQIALATNYLQLRTVDEQRRILEASVVAFTQSLRIAENQYRAGVAPRSDVLQAQTQLETTRAQAIGTGVARAQLEHAIAALIGLPPAELTLPPEPMILVIPEAPIELPSELLERRPDIAAAERRMQVANAQIGVAEAAFFPTISLTATAGSLGTTLPNVARAGDTFWALGVALAQPLFDGGTRSANVELARATWDRTVADYRQTVIVSFQQVEDQLAALRVLAEQAEVQDAALRAAREAERLALNQYQAGTVAYTTVITAQVARLSNEQAALDVLSRRLVATAALVGTLGGSWDATDLPAADRLYDVVPLDPAAPRPAGPPGFWDGFGTAVRNLLK